MHLWFFNQIDIGKQQAANHYYEWNNNGNWYLPPVCIIQTKYVHCSMHMDPFVPKLVQYMKSNKWRKKCQPRNEWFKRWLSSIGFVTSLNIENWTSNIKHRTVLTAFGLVFWLLNQHHHSHDRLSATNGFASFKFTLAYYWNELNLVIHGVCIVYIECIMFAIRSHRWWQIQFIHNAANSLVAFTSFQRICKWKQYWNIATTYNIPPKSRILNARCLIYCTYLVLDAHSE